jgi:CheY-like chemotaxis protein
MTKEPEIELPAPKDSRPPRQTWRILFVDSAENVDRLKKAAKESGYVVVGATTTAEAWRFLNGKDHVDVIVSAAHLERESTFDFLKDVRQSEAHRKTKFLILSLEPGTAGARLDRTAERTGMILGADAYVVMLHFDAAALVEQIRKLQPAVPTLQQSADG